LCTLLLQRGYRVEYSAASDAYTHCPEGFGEFYNQRRRWVPSTMANIMDLLGDYKKTVSVNDNISALYMGYQVSFLCYIHFHIMSDCVSLCQFYLTT
jgi:chitin synthase